MSGDWVHVRLQHDSTLARMLFTLLYEAIFQQADSVLTSKDAEETTASIKEALNTIIDSSKIFHPPFIGSLQVWPMITF